MCVSAFVYIGLLVQSLRLSTCLSVGLDLYEFKLTVDIEVRLSSAIMPAMWFWLSFLDQVADIDIHLRSIPNKIHFGSVLWLRCCSNPFMQCCRGPMRTMQLLVSCGCLLQLFSIWQYPKTSVTIFSICMFISSASCSAATMASSLDRLIALLLSFSALYVCIVVGCFCWLSIFC